nr:nucleolar and spindle-associated protein 1-like [Procambarus clarkii]
MGGEIFAQQDLQQLKYVELLKIFKGRGLKAGRKLKTEKLIEAILESQKSSALAVNAEAVVAALTDAASRQPLKDNDNEKSRRKEVGSAEELLTDIQFPDSFSEDKDEPQEVIATSPKKGRRKSKLIKNVVENDGQITRRRRTATFEIEKKTESTAEETPGPLPKRRKTSTYEVSVETSKSNTISDVSPDIRSEEASKESSEQLNILVQKSNKRQTRGSLSNRSPAVVSNCQMSVKESGSQLNLTTDMDTKPKTSDTQKVLKTSETQSTPKRRSSAKTATPSSTRHSQVGGNRLINTPKSNTKLKQDSKIVKPMFTVGRNCPPLNGKEGSSCGGSNIPRFLSYARKLKVPNFAKIHERAFSRMEALDDYVEKKQKRTDTTDSATKKPQDASEKVFQPTVISTRNLNLNFTSPRSSARKIPTFSKHTRALSEKPKPNPSPKVLQRIQKTPKVPKILETRKKALPSSSKSVESQKTVSKIIGVRQRSPKVARQPLVNKTPRKSIRNAAAVTKSSQKPDLVSALKVMSVKQESPLRRSALPTLLKENVTPGSPCSAVGKRQEYDPKATINKPLNYVPYKGALKPIMDRATLKNMAERKPKLKSTQEIREGQKKILKGVRFNKRFELQMAKRGITL